MKTILALTFLVQTAVAVAGPSVSGGIVYNETFESCANKKEQTTLRVSALLSPKNFIAHLTTGKNTTLLKCVEGDNRRSPITGEEIIWKCDEQRPGDGQLQVYVNRNDFGLKYATVYRADILRRPSKMFTMKCDQQTSN